MSAQLAAWGEQPPLFVCLLGAEVARSNMTKAGQRIGMSRRGQRRAVPKLPRKTCSDPQPAGHAALGGLPALPAQPHLQHRQGEAPCTDLLNAH